MNDDCDEADVLLAASAPRLKAENERLREALRLAVDLLDDLELGLSERQASVLEQVRSAITTDDKP